MKFTATGDAIIQRRIAEDFEGYDELTPFIMQGDARFFNLETTLNHEGETSASQFSGGTYLRANPEVLDDRKENPADFLKYFAHRVINMGANAVVGHGPHLLRPIEVYKDCPIFYSLGDLGLELYSVELAPEDFFKKQGLDSSYTVHGKLKKRSKDFTVGLMPISVCSVLLYLVGKQKTANLKTDANAYRNEYGRT